LLSPLFVKERITRPELVALGLALIRVVLTVGVQGDGELLGIVLALTAAFLYAGHIVVGGKVMKQVDALLATTITMLAAGVSYGSVVAVGGFQPPHTLVGWGAIFGAALCSIIAIGAFFAGLERVGSTNVAILSTIEPIVTVLLAALLLGEEIKLIRLVGGLFILAAVVFLARADIAEAQEGGPV
jgi:drug/metabolite transporter (DMT)-like permease